MTTVARPAESPADRASARMFRFEVRVRERVGDPRARSLLREATAIDLSAGQAGASPDDVRIARVYLVRAALSDDDARRVGAELLSNPVTEDVALGAAPVEPGAVCIEVHPLPGVMDPPAQTVEMAVRELTDVEDVRAATGWRYDFSGLDAPSAERIARRLLANPVIQAIHHEPFLPDDFPRGEARAFSLTHIPIRALSDDELSRLSREAHLFLSLDEMRVIRDHYRAQEREPTDIELETLAQTWSEHCVHKTLKADVVYRGPSDDAIDWSSRQGHEVRQDGSVVISNLLRSTVAAATFELIEEGVDWTLSVFVDNAGVIDFDDAHAVCVKVETHNHPSAIEPYGGAATGVGGCIRDIIGTGLAARPIANTDVFCVAYPDGWRERSDGGAPAAASKPLPAGCLHPKRILQQVVAGVRDYGNRMGVPTVSGGVYFDDRYVGNPLVYCGCVGVMPKNRIAGDARDGDLIIALGGRTGRDGVHGATFSSAELTDTHADEFAHAVQIGNPIEEKKVLDAILRARDHADGPLFSAITDCGAGGFSSAVGEMGEALGAEVHLDRAPLKYDGLTYSEIWISEAQERMILAVPRHKLDALQAICDEESVELAQLGHFGTPGRELVLFYHGQEVGRLEMSFLHDGLPRRTREAVWKGAVGHENGRDARSTDQVARRDARSTGQVAGEIDASSTGTGTSAGERLLKLLAHPNIASKRFIVRQYDHEVQGATVLKPLVGPGGVGPGDASVVQPVPGSRRAVAISQGLAVPAGDPAQGGDPHRMAIAATDECVRNLVCVGADPDRIAILDNFCWPSCEKPENMGALVRAAAGCYDAAKAYRTPFVSGKDSLNNQFTTEDGRTIEIPPTLLITGVGIVHDLDRCVTMDLKPINGSALLLIHAEAGAPGGDIRTVLSSGPLTARFVANAIARGDVLAAHDCSEGGALVAVAEMTLAVDPEDSIGAAVRMAGDEATMERLGAYVLQVPADAAERILNDASDAPMVEAQRIGIVQEGVDGVRLNLDGADEMVGADTLRRAFLGTLDW